MLCSVIPSISFFPVFPSDLRPNSAGPTLKLTAILPQMAKRISEWNSDDCMEFVQKTAKVTRGKITDSDAEVVCQAFRSNNIHGSSLTQLDDTDWRQLIPNVGVRRELQAATARKIHDEEIALRTALFFKGRPVKPVDEVPALRALPKITSYFTPASNNVLDLPEETLPNITIDEPVVFQESASLLNRENIGKFIEYMLGRRERLLWKNWLT